METTNNLKYNVTKTLGKFDYVINVRLNDECKNGHEDFSITGTIYKAGKRGDNNVFSGGAIGDKIADKFPEFAIFNKLHLSQFNGVPMHAIGNGLYWMQQGNKEHAVSTLRITDEEFKCLDAIKHAGEEYFTHKLIEMGLVERWKDEANQAIKLLEQLTGNKFQSTATQARAVELTREQTEEIKKQEKSGYYTEEAISKRQSDKVEAEKAKKIENLIKEHTKKRKEADKDLEINIFLIQQGLSQFAAIYYKHTNEVCFNWSTNKTTRDQYDQLMKHKDLPKGVNYKFEK
jgi:hypothetical protein